MKPQTYFRLALLFPYVLWIVLALLAYLFSAQEASSGWDILLIPVMFYTIGIILWFIPYTLLAIGLWIGSRNKSVKTLYRLALIAPLLLFALMFIEVAILYQPARGNAELTEALTNQAALLGGSSFIFGYLSVGIAAGVYKILEARKFILDETPIPAVN